MKKLLTLLLLTGSLLCNAQNYQCLQSGAKHYFINGNGYLRGIRIDSVQTVGSDTIFYPYKTMRSATYPQDTSRGSWLGSHVIQKADGSFLFNTVWNDTVIIKTQANPGDSWICYNDISATYYVANVLSADTMSILGVLDSIKRIGITSYTGGTINTTDSINNFEIILSKHNGFVKAFDLYMFPYHNPDTSVHSTLYDLYSSATGYISYRCYVFSLVNYHVPSQMDIFSFSLSDAFFNRIQRTQTGYYWLLSNTDMYDSIVSKTIIDAYHVNYEIYNWTLIKNFDLAGHETDHFDTGTHLLTVDTTKIFNAGLLPEELGTNDTIYYYKPNDTTHCYVSDVYTKERYLGFEMCPYDHTYKAGFEQISSNSYDFSGSTDYTGCYAVTTSGLLFSIKDGVFCGTHPMPPNGVKEITINTNYSLYPNPATDELIIKTANTLPHTITLTNMMGQLVTTIHTIKAQETIKVTNIPAGVYNVTITDEGGNRHNEKVVVVH